MSGDVGRCLPPSSADDDEGDDIGGQWVKEIEERLLCAAPKDLGPPAIVYSAPPIADWTSDKRQDYLHIALPAAAADRESSQGSHVNLMRKSRWEGSWVGGHARLGPIRYPWWELAPPPRRRRRARNP